ncbi:MAG: ribulose-phosphate 3-epimerase [Candidatus Liptonbacteria bacterium]|nr:ribulose-phosphate 3-epimerase [Candidatus Liptonbacteria bacterium]
MEVIPALNCHDKDFDCIREKARIADGLGAWAHLDVADARYTFNKTWGDSEDWAKLKTRLQLEVHLMAEEPEKYAREWLLAGAKRIIVHAETLNYESAEKMLAMAKEHGAEAMLAFSPETQIESAVSYMGMFLGFLVLAVHPGLPGQNFLPLVLEKIKLLREKYPNAKIEVDGGINYETGKRAKEAGADILVSASYIFGDKNPQAAYQNLVSL